MYSHVDEIISSTPPVEEFLMSGGLSQSFAQWTIIPSAYPRYGSNHLSMFHVLLSCPWREGSKPGIDGISRRYVLTYGGQSNTPYARRSPPFFWRWTKTSATVSKDCGRMLTRIGERVPSWSHSDFEPDFPSTNFGEYLPEAEFFLFG